MVKVSSRVRVRVGVGVGALALLVSGLVSAAPAQAYVNGFQASDKSIACKFFARGSLTGGPLVACLSRSRNVLVRFQNEVTYKVSKATASQRAQFPASLRRIGRGAALFVGPPPVPGMPGVYECSTARDGSGVRCGGIDTAGAGFILTRSGRVKVCPGFGDPCRTVFRG